MDPGLLASIRADLLAHDRFEIAPGWSPRAGGLRGWWWRYRRNHHAAGIIILFRLRERALTRRWPLVPSLCDRLLEWVHGTQISRGVRLGRGVYFPHGDAHIHGHTTIGECTIVGVQAAIGLRGSFFGGDMGTRGPTIGSYVRIGTGARLLGGITVGDRAVIGAGAVVIDDVPEAATVVGVPARVVRQGPTADELPAALERLEAMRRMAEAAAPAPGEAPETIERL
ncbi:MAG TPA: hypothetical protein VNM91_07510 [Dehalococcoidia bacterium]|nr:hypothetical protein [Dehalococcoidia bacterium]